MIGILVSTPNSTVKVARCLFSKFTGYAAVAVVKAGAEFSVADTHNGRGSWENLVAFSGRRTEGQTGQIVGCYIRTLKLTDIHTHAHTQRNKHRRIHNKRRNAGSRTRNTCKKKKRNGKKEKHKKKKNILLPTHICAYISIQFGAMRVVCAVYVMPAKYIKHTPCKRRK